MAPFLARPAKTVEDLQALPEDVRAELIAGELYVTPAPWEPHQFAAGEIFALLREHVRRHAGGRVYIAPLDVHLPGGHVVQPDVFWISPEHVGIVRESVHGAPDLVVEVVSPTHPERDRFVKRALYAESGVREYWIADPATKSVEVLVLASGAYRPAGYFVPGTRLVSPLLPGLSIAVEELFTAPPPTSPRTTS